MGLGLHRTNTVGHDPEDQNAETVTTHGLAVLFVEWTWSPGYAGTAVMVQNKRFKMTLCGSEVPQDRWRGRTAGSGMWTLTRDNLLSWSLDDPAIPYG